MGNNNNNKRKYIGVPVHVQMYIGMHKSTKKSRIAPVKNRPKWLEASTTARYPEMLLMEESASKTCALEILGTQSIPKAVSFLLASSSIRDAFCFG